MTRACYCRPGCQLHPLSVHYPAREAHWNSDTAPLVEQERLKMAHSSGLAIEAKGRDTIDCGYVWGIVASPKWDFRNNYYRVAGESN